MAEQHDELRRVYGRIVGLEHGLTAGTPVPQSIVEDFFELLDRTEAATDEEDLDSLRNIRLEDYGDGRRHAAYNEFRPKVSQLRSLLEHGYHVADRVVEIGSLYNSIEDGELRSRCADLLSAASHFDRVINQATLVLEDRIRRKASADKSLVGVKLINEVIKAKPSESRLVISSTPEEQEGIANICRGLMLALRNETHHHLVEGFSREEAFHICGFIDRILKLVDNAQVR